MMKKNVSNFLFCGLTGWCLECVWTGLFAGFSTHDRSLTCKTSLWMFPIYGLAAMIKPVSTIFHNSNAFMRGGVYSCCITLTEFCTGKILKKYKACPWDYSKIRLNIDGVIRFDYIPVWFMTGLLYEKLLKKR